MKLIRLQIGDRTSCFSRGENEWVLIIKVPKHVLLDEKRRKISINGLRGTGLVARNIQTADPNIVKRHRDAKPGQDSVSFETSPGGHRS